MSTFLSVLIALTPAAQEDASPAPGSRLNEFFSSILPYRDGALFNVPYNFLPIVASLQLSNGNEDNPRQEMLEELSAFASAEFVEPRNVPTFGWVDQLALDWGTAEIGPGFLYPQQYGVPRRSGGMPGQSPDGSGFGRALSSLADPLPDPPGSPTGPTDIQPVPEPSSILAWLTVLAAGACWWRRKHTASFST